MLLRSQKSIVEQIIAGNADYILSLKDNHPTLHQQVKNWFETAQSLDFKGVDVSISQRVEKGHHRINITTISTIIPGRAASAHNPNSWPMRFQILLLIFYFSCSLTYTLIRVRSPTSLRSRGSCCSY